MRAEQVAIISHPTLQHQYCFLQQIVLSDLFRYFLHEIEGAKTTVLTNRDINERPSDTELDDLDLSLVNEHYVLDAVMINLLLFIVKLIFVGQTLQLMFNPTQ